MSGLTASLLAWMVAGGMPRAVLGEWRAPSPTELSDTWRDESPHRYSSIQGDFDGDGEADRAGFFVGVDNRTLALLVYLSSQPKNALLLETFDDTGWLGVMGVDLVEPGSYATACGKGYWECEAGEPEELTLALPAIDLFKEGSANSFFFYDPDTHSFRRVWISD